jgi:hypothetical protein
MLPLEIGIAALLACSLDVASPSYFDEGTNNDSGIFCREIDD